MRKKRKKTQGSSTLQEKKKKMQDVMLGIVGMLIKNILDNGWTNKFIRKLKSKKIFMNSEKDVSGRLVEGNFFQLFLKGKIFSFKLLMKKKYFPPLSDH
jgi:hypothetical protein